MCVLCRARTLFMEVFDEETIDINLEMGIISISHCRALIARNRDRDTNPIDSRGRAGGAAVQLHFVYLCRSVDRMMADRHLQILTHRVLWK